MVAKAILILFVGGSGGSPVEEMLLEAQGAIVRDILEQAVETDAFHGFILVTNQPAMAQGLPPGTEVEIDPGGAPFHLGQRLREVIEKYHVERPFYMGGGGLPLLGTQGLAEVAQQLGKAENTVITNNLYSADLVAFTPGSALSTIPLPQRDNPLAFLLSRQGGLKDVSLPRNAATQLDVDTPTDLLILSLHPGTGPHLRTFLDQAALDTTPLRRAMASFTDPLGQVVVAGRVGSHLWAYLEKETACRVRFFSEERGMGAEGREERGEVRSLLGFYLQQVGTAAFFRTLAQLGDAVFIDSRVVFGHLGLHPSGPDRYYSDLGQVREIKDPMVREFTEGALEAPLPVVLGGHSLVSGGLWALVEAAWLEEDRKRLTGGG
ncbi:MAG: hypothetical protein HYU86_00050 [Chloroflexi bacterium]|nr:hypothetical protein [Chloroflexota bacterium]